MILKLDRRPTADASKIQDVERKKIISDHTATNRQKLNDNLSSFVMLERLTSVTQTLSDESLKVSIFTLNSFINAIVFFKRKAF